MTNNERKELIISRAALRIGKDLLKQVNFSFMLTYLFVQTQQNREKHQKKAFSIRPTCSG